MNSINNIVSIGNMVTVTSRKIYILNFFRGKMISEGFIAQYLIYLVIVVTQENISCWM